MDKNLIFAPVCKYETSSVILSFPYSVSFLFFAFQCSLVLRNLGISGGVSGSNAVQYSQLHLKMHPFKEYPMHQRLAEQNFETQG